MSLIKTWDTLPCLEASRKSIFNFSTLKTLPARELTQKCLVTGRSQSFNHRGLVIQWRVLDQITVAIIT